MIIEIGEKGLSNSFQAPFKPDTKCKCGGVAKMAMVLQERGEGENGSEYICQLHPNSGKGHYWPHDAIAVALYFCRECFEPVVVWNQA